METSLKRARAAGAPSATLDGNATAIAELHAAALNKIADLQLRLDACEKSRSYMHGKHRLEVDTLKSKNEGLKSALRWAYSIDNIPRQHWLDEGYDEEYADQIEKFFNSFKQIIQSLRIGTAAGRIVIDYDVRDEDGDFLGDAADHEEFLMPYWKEFAAALKHWSDHYADEIFLDVVIRDFDIPKAVLDTLRPAFEQSRVESFVFCGSDHPGDMADFAKRVLQSNHSILKVSFADITFAHEDLKTICSAIKSRNLGGQSIEHLCLSECFEDGIETQTLQMIIASITATTSKEVSLDLTENGMSSREAVVIAEFLCSNPTISNPTISRLNLSKNRFDNAEAAVLANALSSNTNLRSICVRNNYIKATGRLAFLRAIFDVSSLVSCASSNHICQVYGLEQDISALNGYISISMNKWEKIFAMLALSSEDSFINTSLLRGIPAKLIPVLLDWADRQAEEGESKVTDLYLELTNMKRCKKHDVWDKLGETRRINCVYGLMKSWVVPMIFA